MLFPIRERKSVAKNTTEITFEVSGNFTCLPGQNVEVTLPSPKHHDIRGNSRIMSIVSAPYEAPRLSILFRNSPSAWKQNILKLKIGEMVDISKPFGFFTLPKDTTRALFWMAGGVGIAPFISMARHIKKLELPYSPKLLYANNNSEEIAYKEELASLSPIFHKGKIETIPEYLPNSLFYVAGPLEMTIDVSKLLENSGITPESILTEVFTGY